MLLQALVDEMVELEDGTFSAKKVEHQQVQQQVQQQQQQQQAVGVEVVEEVEVCDRERVDEEARALPMSIYNQRESDSDPDTEYTLKRGAEISKRVAQEVERGDRYWGRALEGAAAAALLGMHGNMSEE